MWLLCGCVPNLVDELDVVYSYQELLLLLKYIDSFCVCVLQRSFITVIMFLGTALQEIYSV